MSNTAQTDTKGREIFSVHPEILAGGAAYRRADQITDAQPNAQAEAEQDEQTTQKPGTTEQ